MPGPGKTPTALRKLRGNPGKRPLPKNEPKPRVDAPEMPAGLSKAAQAHWKRVVEEGVRLRLITTLDDSLLTSYIVEWDIVKTLGDETLKRGSWITMTEFNRSGEEIETGQKRAPWCTALAQHQMLLRGLRADLGFSPTARTKVQTVEDDTGQMAELFAFDGGKK